MEIFLGFIIFVAGTCLGSFVNMLEYRTSVSYGLRKSKVRRPEERKRSFCDYCGRQLRWSENIPIVSWLLLGGKSSCCGKKLPLTYPIVELLTGGLFYLFFMNLLNESKLDFGWIFWLKLMILLAVAVLLVFETLFDFNYMIIPDFATAALVVLGAALWILDSTALGKFNVYNWLSAVGGFVFLLLLYLTTRGKGMGFGDVKLAFFMGLFLGFPNILTAMYLAFIGGAVVGLVLLLLKKVGRKTQIPFGPYLITATIIAYLWGGPIWYLAVGMIK